MRLDRDRAHELLHAARVARLATVDDAGRPHLVPVTFALHADRVAITVDHKPKSTRDLKRLRNIAANPAVSLLADEYDEDWTRLWWVRADGTATVLTDPAAMAQPIGWLVAKYAQYQATVPRGPVILISVTRLAGWSGRG